MAEHPTTVAPHAVWPEQLVDTLGPAPLWYHCQLCGAPIPEGCFVLVDRADNGETDGVRVQDHDGNTRHECGEQVFGHDLTPEERVKQGIAFHPSVQV